MAGARAAFPNTGLSVSANFLSTPEQFYGTLRHRHHLLHRYGRPRHVAQLYDLRRHFDLVFNGQYGGTNYRGQIALDI